MVNRKEMEITQIYVSDGNNLVITRRARKELIASSISILGHGVGTRINFDRPFPAKPKLLGEGSKVGFN